MSESILDIFDKKVAKDKAAAEKQDKGNTIINDIKEATRKPNEPKGVDSKVNNSKPSNKATAVKEPDKKNGYNPPKCTDERFRYIEAECGKCYECRKKRVS